MNKLRSAGMERQRGISFIEILVAMVIGLIILGGVMQSLLTNQRNNGWSDDVAYIQENARYAMEMLSRDIRWAGYWGCAANVSDPAAAITVYGNALDVADDHDWLRLEGIQGYEGSVSTMPAGLVATGNTLWADNADYSGNTDFEPDAIIFRGASSDLELAVERHRRGGARFDFFVVNPDIAVDDLIVAVSEDCRKVGLTQVSARNNNRILHRETGSGDPGNCTRALPGDESFTCNTGNSGLTPAWGPGSTILRYAAVGYYIGTSVSDATQPALFRVQYTGMDGTDVEVQTDEIAMGVEDMQILYGVDGNGDGLANVYLRADDIDVAAEEWKQVVSMRISLLMRGYGNTREGTAAVTYIGFPYAGAADTYLGQSYTDDVLRQQVSKTIRVRNNGAG